MTIFFHRDYFSTTIFNKAFSDYEATVLPALAHRYLLVSGKGGSRFSNRSDMTYLTHIINGLYPASLVLEEVLQSKGAAFDPDLDSVLRAYILGFTLHDLNKLTGIDDLEQAVTQKLQEVSESLDAEKFLPDWENRIDDLKFLILRTENRTRNLANSLNMGTPQRRRLFHEYLAEACTLADKLGGLVISPEDSSAFCNEVRKVVASSPFQVNWEVYYFGVGATIHTVLNQLLVRAVYDHLEASDRRVLFTNVSGGVYTGKALAENETASILEHLVQNVRNLVNPADSTHIAWDKCQIGQKGLIPLKADDITDIIKRHKLDQIFTIAKKQEGGLNDEEYGEMSRIINDVIKKTRLPLRFVEVGRQKKRTILAYEDGIKEWDDLDDAAARRMQLAAVYKMRHLMASQNQNWSRELKELITRQQETLSPEERSSAVWQHLGNPRGPTCKTMAALQASQQDIEASQTEDDLTNRLKQVIDSTLEWINKGDFDIAATLNAFVQERVYFPGFISTSGSLRLTPPKTEACAVCGQTASQPFDDGVAFGFGPRQFAGNRSMNRLKVVQQKICRLCSLEMVLRKSISPKGGRETACLYFDAGDYLVPFRRATLVDFLQKASDFELSKGAVSVSRVFERCLAEGLPFVFWNIPDKTDEQFRCLKYLAEICRHTGLKFYCTDLMTPYHLQKEMLVFEKGNPFIRALRWDRTRIDQISQLLEEMNLIENVGGRRLTGLILDYAADRRAIFTYLYFLDDKARRKFQEPVLEFAWSRKEDFCMTEMGELAKLAAEIDFSERSRSSETWMFREAVDILQRCLREKSASADAQKLRDTFIEQVSGTLRQRMGFKRTYNLAKLKDFPARFYDVVFKEMWAEQIPPPARRKHYLYQFALLYAEESANRGRAYSAIRKGVEDVLKKNPEVLIDEMRNSLMQLPETAWIFENYPEGSIAWVTTEYNRSTQGKHQKGVANAS
jgi:hypothetical protein